MVPQAFAMTLLMCGPDVSMDEYIDCFSENVTWVSGMSGGERLLHLSVANLTAQEKIPAYKKHVASNKDAEVWFSRIPVMQQQAHTVMIPPSRKQFEIPFEEKYGVAPER